MKQAPMVIEEGVPFPERKFCARTRAGDAGSKLKIGQSVFCSSGEKETVRQAIYRIGGLPLQRVAFKDGVKGWRVWRIA